MAMANEAAALITGRLFSAGKVLIMTHQRPDGDALGSACGLRAFLRHHGLKSEVLIPGNYPDRFRQLCPGMLREVADLAEFDLFVAVDCANPERLGTLPALPVELLRQKNFISIDHHRGNSVAAPVEYLDPTASSTSLMVAELLIASGREIPQAAATLLLTGMMTDTGCFCFANTDARTFETAAELTRCGAEISRIANNVFFSKPLKQLQFEAELVTGHFRFACGGKFVYAFVPQELLDKYSFDMKEDEGLIDILRKIDSCVIALLCHRREDGIRCSFRSKDEAFPVGPLARKYGGGGHDMAAGMTLAAADFADAEAVIVPEIEALLNFN